MSLKLDTKKTALVVIDLQNGIVGRQIAPHSAAEIMERSSRLAAAFREKGGTVVYVRVDLSDFLQLPVDEPTRLPETLPPSLSALAEQSGFQSGDIVITKRHWGAFAGTKLEQMLRERGVETVVLTGISTNIGVESTARQGTGLSFAFVIVEDACGAQEAEEHRYSFQKIFPRLARIRTTEDVLAALA